MSCNDCQDCGPDLIVSLQEAYLRLDTPDNDCWRLNCVYQSVGHWDQRSLFSNVFAHFLRVRIPPYFRTSIHNQMLLGVAVCNWPCAKFATLLLRILMQMCATLCNPLQNRDVVKIWFAAPCNHMQLCAMQPLGFSRPPDSTTLAPLREEGMNMGY